MARAIRESDLVERADLVAAVAHGAIGQCRADGVTPYIDHPRRAASLVLEWNDRGVVRLSDEQLERCTAAALMHDVLEDTKLPRSELDRAFADVPKVVDLVARLTEIPGDPDNPAYYENIAKSREATIVKCADRCANLDDVLEDVCRGRSIGRWRRYIVKTERDVWPILRDEALEAQLRHRIAAIEAALAALPQEAGTANRRMRGR